MTAGLRVRSRSFVAVPAALSAGARPNRLFSQINDFASAAFFCTDAMPFSADALDS